MTAGLSHLDGEVARAAAAGCEGLSPEAATMMADAGCVYCFDGAALVLQLSWDPVIRLRDAFLHAHTGELDSGELAPVLRDRLGIDRLIVRSKSRDLRPPLALLALGVEKRAFLPRRRSGDVSVRPVSAAERPFVQGLLRDAVVAGALAAGAGDDGLADRAAAYVAERYPVSARGSVRAHVAVIGGRPVGHVTWLPGAVDPLTGVPHVEVVDTMTVSVESVSGVGAALLAPVEAFAARRHLGLRGHVSATPDGRHEKVLEGLLADGWSVLFALGCLSPTPSPRGDS